MLHGDVLAYYMLLVLFQTCQKKYNGKNDRKDIFFSQS